MLFRKIVRKNVANRFILKKRVSKTAEELMRSRYAAFAIPNGEYLWQNHCQQKKIPHDKSELEYVWGKKIWTKLEIIQF